LYFSVFHPLLFPWEPLIIVIQLGYHLYHGSVHFNHTSIWEVTFQLKLSIRCTIIKLRWFYAHIWISLYGNFSIDLIASIDELNTIQKISDFIL
jgi:hypothetical protein